MRSKKPTKKKRPTVKQLLRQIEQLKKRVNAGAPAQIWSDPQFGHAWPLSDGEKRFVSIMRQIKPKYCLPKKEQHPKLRAWAAAPRPIIGEWKKDYEV